MFTHQGNGFGQAGVKTGGFRDAVSSGSKYLLLFCSSMEKRSISRMSDSFPDRVKERREECVGCPARFNL